MGEQYNICDNAVFTNALDQKRRMQIFNIPPSRINLQQSPYNGNITKFDLDMRRKAEILEYKSNRMCSQTNNPTKAQQYSSIMTGNNSRRIRPPANISECRLPSSASGVPGNLILYNDPNIELYNMKSQSQSYGIQPKPIVDNRWNYTRIQNIYSAESEFTTFTTIYMVAVDQPSRTFRINTPVVLMISDTALASTPLYNDVSGLGITIQTLSVNVKYSANNVDINGQSSQFTQFEPSKSIDMSFNLPAGTASYTAYCYLGLFEINNLNLQTESGYIYDIQMKVTTNIKRSDAYMTKFGTPDISLILNASMFDISYRTPTYTIYGGIPQAVPIPSSFPMLSVV